MSDFSLFSYSYELRSEDIALMPANPPESAKLLVYNGASLDIQHTIFANVSDILSSGDILFLNDSRVLPARIVRDDAIIHRPSGKVDVRSIELLYLRSHDEHSFETMVYPGDYFPVGSEVQIGEYVFSVDAITYEGRTFSIKNGKNIIDFLMKYGKLPLPPYIGYSDERAEKYQTEFAKKDGSLAAPTASLHFTLPLLEKLEERGVLIEYATLHVGIGTFKIMNAPDIRDHEMHDEYFEVERTLFDRIARYKQENKRIIAVWTTMVRTLESLPMLWITLPNEVRESYRKDTKIFWDALTKNLTSADKVCFISCEQGFIRGATRLFIMPGYKFLIVNAIFTNFHLPESTLLVMMSAFVWREKLFDLYTEAQEKQYRFYSFGDGMFLTKKLNWV